MRGGAALRGLDLPLVLFISAAALMVDVRCAAATSDHASACAAAASLAMSQPLPGSSSHPAGQDEAKEGERPGGSSELAGLLARLNERHSMNQYVQHPELLGNISWVAPLLPR